MGQARVYERADRLWPLVAIFAVTLPGLVWAIVRAGAEPVLIFYAVSNVVFLAQLAWLAWVRPRRIVSDDDGLRFVSTLRTVAVPWQHLRSVTVCGYRRQSLRWSFRWRPWLVTTGKLRGRHRLLAEVVERAPRARVRL